MTARLSSIVRHSQRPPATAGGSDLTPGKGGRMRKLVLGLCLLSLLPLAAARTQNRPALSQETREFITVDAPSVALAHVRVIDGTGGPALADQTVVISAGKIQSV